MWFIVPMAVTPLPLPRRIWSSKASCSDSPGLPSGRLGEPEEGDPVDAVAHVEEEVLAVPAGQLQRLDQLHAEHVLVPRDGLGHVPADERDVVEPPQLELGVGVLGSGHAAIAHPF